MAIPFDTLEFTKELQSAGIPSEQAEAQIRVLSKVFEQRESLYRENLANKRDLKELEMALRKDIEILRNELKKDIEVLRHDVQKEISIKNAELKSSMIRWVAGMLLAQAGLITALEKILS